MNQTILPAFVMVVVAALMTVPLAAPVSAKVVDPPQRSPAEIAAMCAFPAGASLASKTATYDDAQPGATEPQVKQGFDAYRAGSMQDAYDTWIPLAIAGNATAQYYLGTLFVADDADDQSMQCAIQWHQAAAAQEHVGANAGLGHLLGFGDHDFIDREQALAALLFAAERCHLDAQFQLGSLYGRAPKPYRDFIEAHKWLMVAGTRGHIEAKDTNKILRRFTSVAELREGNRRHKIWLKEYACN